MNRKIWALVVMLGLIVVVFLQLDIVASPQSTESELTFANTSFHQQRAYVAFLNYSQSEAQNLNDTKPMKIRQCEVARIPLYNLEELCKPIDFIVHKETEQPEEMKEDNVEKKKIVLTFDDGPHPKVTERILDVLDQYGIKATFFVLGENVVKYPEIVKQAADQDHEIANHSWSHANFTKLSGAQISAELNRTNEAIYKVTGSYSNLYRPPYGATNANVRGQTTMESIMWSVDTLDWKHRTPEKTVAYVKEQAKDNGIILMHDIHSETADSLDAVIRNLIEQDFEFVTVSELLELQT